MLSPLSLVTSVVVVTYSACEGMQVCSCSDLRYVRTPHGGAHVPCGRCPACLALKGLGRVERLTDCLSEYPVRYLVTLTYDDDHLPVALFDDDTHDFVSDRDCDYNGVCYSVSAYDVYCSDTPYPLLSLSRYGGLPVLSRRDMILFKKRFRKEYHKYYNEQIYIYVCGEYGPTTFRPHYHLLLGFKSLLSIESVRAIVHKAWSCRAASPAGRPSRVPLGFTDIKFVDGTGVSKYVAQYLNCTAQLPSCIAHGAFRPFCQCSRGTDIRQRLYGLDEQSFFAEPHFECDLLSVVDNTPVTRQVPSFFEARVFPKHKSFDLLTDEDRVRVAGFVSHFVDFEHFFDYMHSKPFDNSSLGFAFFNDVILGSVYDIHQRRLVLYRNWLVFRRYLNNASRFGVSLLDYVRRLSRYYADKGLFQLNRFLSFVQDFSFTHSLDETLSLYYNTEMYPLRDYRLLPEYVMFHSRMSSIIANTTKTKKRNDYFVAHGLKRPSFVSNVLHFKSKFL